MKKKGEPDEPDKPTYVDVPRSYEEKMKAFLSEEDAKFWRFHCPNCVTRASCRAKRCGCKCHQIENVEPDMWVRGGV
jgi:hypothetical protein